MDGQRCILVFCSLSLLCSASASFYYGQPCSDRNTAYLYSTDWIIPENETNCVDITGCGNVDLVNYGTFFQLTRKADTLYADHMNLSRFPVFVIFSLPRLEMLDLSGNDIRKLPYKMHKIMPNVKKMLLSENAIFIPKKRPLFKSASIWMLMLSSNMIGHVYPVTFSKMPNLQILYLDGNRLKHISPEVFSPLASLAYLHLGSNAIAEVPPKDQMPGKLKFYITDNQKKVIK